MNGLLSLPNFLNPVQFICGGSFDTAAGPSAPDYFRRAEICRERLGPVLRRLTVNYPPIMFHPINTITAYKGQIIYDTPATQAKAETPVPELTWIPATPTPPAPASNQTDLQALLVPRAPGPQPGYGPLPGPAPGSVAPGPPPTERGLAGEPNLVARQRISFQQRTAGRLQFRRAELPADARHRRPRQRRVLITVEVPDVATLPQNSPVMVDDVTVGSVSGISAEQRSDGSFMPR